MNERSRVLYLTVLLACLPLLLYSFSLKLPFMFDDFFLYAELSGNSYNEKAIGPSLYHLIDPEVLGKHPHLVPWWTSQDTEIHFFRPLSSLSLSMDYRIWKDNPAGYHLTNLILHSLSGIVLFLIGRLLFQRDAVAFLAALVFITYPWVLFVVFWVAERSSLLSLLFGLCGLYAHMRYRRRDPWGWEALAWGCFFLALFSRESGVIGIATYFLYDLFLWRRDSPGKWPGIFRLGIYYAFFSLPIIAYIVYYKLSGCGSAGYYSVFDGTDSVHHQIAFLFKNVFLYLSSFLFMVPIFSETNIDLFKRLIYFLPFLAMAVLALVFVYPGIKKNLFRERACLFLISWSLLSLLPTVHLLTQNRYLYTAAVPLCLLLSGYLFTIKRDKLFGRLSSLVFYGLIAFYVVIPTLTANLKHASIDKLFRRQEQVVQETRGFLEGAQTPANVFFMNVSNPLLTFALQHAFDYYTGKGQVRAFALTITRDVPDMTALDDHTILIESKTHPFLETDVERLFMTDIERIRREGFTRSNVFFDATIAEVEDGHIHAIRFDFASKLTEEPMHFFFMQDRRIHRVSFPVTAGAFPFRIVPDRNQK